MAGSLVGWAVIAIIVCVIIIIGGVALPIIVPMMRGYTSASSDIIETGSPFMQLLIQWWPLTIPLIMLFAIIAIVMLRRNNGGGSIG